MWGHSPDSDPFLVARSPSPETYNRTALDEDRAASLRNAALCGDSDVCAGPDANGDFFVSQEGP